MAKKIIALLLLAVVIGTFIPTTILANGSYTAKDSSDAEHTIYYKGFVPCGLGKTLYTDETYSTPLSITVGSHTYKSINCQFCHFFVMFKGIVNYIIIDIVPPLAVLMIVVGGIMFYLGGGKPELLSTAKSLLKGVVIGLFLIYGAYMIVGLVLSLLGVTQLSGLQEWAQNGVFQIKCPITIP